MKTIAFFNAKGGTGKTTLAFHLAHMLPRLGYPTLAVDLDPQANLSVAFFGEERLEEIWQSEEGMMFPSLEPLIAGTGDLGPIVPIEMAEDLHVLAGDIRLSWLEESLSADWPKLLGGDQRPLRSTTAIYRLIEVAAEAVGATVTLLDLGPNVGALNRSALLAADRVLFPLAADLFSIVGLSELGSVVLRGWREQWKEVLELHAAEGTAVDLPAGDMAPLGYVILQHDPKRSSKWSQQIPRAFREGILGEDVEGEVPEDDPYHLATLRSYHGLIAMAQEAHKPMFDLKVSDGALGSYASLAQKALREFRMLADRIAAVAGLTHPSQP